MSCFDCSDHFSEVLTDNKITDGSTSFFSLSILLRPIQIKCQDTFLLVNSLSSQSESAVVRQLINSD